MFGLRFHDPAYLALLALVPLLAALFFVRRGRAAAIAFPGAGRLAALPRGWRVRLLWVPPTLLLAGLSAAVVALARPQLPSTPAQRELTAEGLDIAVALDLSTSMLAEDMPPSNRVEAAKAALRDLIERRPNDRLALVVFSGKAYTQVPLTLDHGVLQQALDRLQAGGLEDGTAIGDAIGVSLNRLRDSEAKGKAVVLITDGDSNAGRLTPKDAAALAEELHVPVFPILVGSGGSARAPVRDEEDGRVTYHRVEAPVNPQLLEELASISHGRFQRALGRADLERGLHRVLDAMDRTRLSDGGVTSQPRELFGGLLLAALGLALTSVSLGGTVFRVKP
jgi:Ca-activated chloride channel family protein